MREWLAMLLFIFTLCVLVAPRDTGEAFNWLWTEFTQGLTADEVQR